MEEFQEFPKIVHLGGDPNASHKIVMSSDEEGLAEGYSVASFEAAEESENEKAPTKEELAEQAKALGIAVDSRWGVKRLQEEISKKVV